MHQWAGPALPPPRLADLAATKVAATAANRHSQVHQLDLASRALMSSVISALPQVGSALGERVAEAVGN